MCSYNTHDLYTIITIMQRLMGWGYMRLCCHLVGSRSLIDLLYKINRCYKMMNKVERYTFVRKLYYEMENGEL